MVKNRKARKNKNILIRYSSNLGGKSTSKQNNSYIHLPQTCKEKIFFDRKKATYK